MRKTPRGMLNFDEIQLLLPLPLPPRPGVKFACCPKCGNVHVGRAEQLECLADHSQP